MMRTHGLLLILILFFSIACSRNATTPPEQGAEPIANESLAFDISAVNQQPQQWLATYTSNGKTAKFRIELGATKDSGDKIQQMSFGKGKFLREPGSEPEGFLIDLGKVLEATKVPKRVQKSDSLQFEYVILGRSQSRSREDSFADSPAGDWTVTKIFLGDDEGEVFFNFNPVVKKAEFSIKDSGYGNFVIAELSKVL